MKPEKPISKRTLSLLALLALAVSLAVPQLLFLEVPGFVLFGVIMALRSPRGRHNLKRNTLVVGGGLTVLIVLTPLLLLVYHFVTAPKFSAIHYTGTDAGYGCLAVITDAGCYTHYEYQATGSEKAIATAVAAEMKKKGYTFGDQTDSTVAKVYCDETELNTPFGSFSDSYAFSKLTTQFFGLNRYIRHLHVNFYHVERSSDDSSDTFGCANKVGNYHIELSFE